MKPYFPARFNFMKNNEISIFALTKKSFYISSRNATKIKFREWSGIWKHSCFSIAGALLIVTLPFPADSHSPKAYEWDDSYLQPILEPDRHLSLSRLLAEPEKYHQRLIRVRGQVTRLELHLDETKYFIDFVFFLKDAEERVLVFGRHDRTRGDIQLTSDHMVEVHGRFWKERIANGHRLANNLEAHQIRFYPPRNPDHARSISPPENELSIVRQKFSPNLSTKTHRGKADLTQSLNELIARICFST